jgi:hypothetical protein
MGVLKHKHGYLEAPFGVFLSWNGAARSWEISEHGNGMGAGTRFQVEGSKLFQVACSQSDVRML